MVEEELKKLGICPENIDTNYNRISWDTYFMQIANLISKRSHDAQTQHGCVFVKNNRIISTGVNGFPEGSPDSILPNLRFAKYKFISHAEENAIFNAAKMGISLDGSKVYITGLPCGNCSRKLISVGVKEWIVGNIGYQATEEDILLRKFWVEYFGVKIKEFK